MHIFAGMHRTHIQEIRFAVGKSFPDGLFLAVFQRSEDVTATVAGHADFLLGNAKLLHNVLFGKVAHRYDFFCPSVKFRNEAVVVPALDGRDLLRKVKGRQVVGHQHRRQF